MPEDIEDSLEGLFNGMLAKNSAVRFTIEQVKPPAPYPVNSPAPYPVNSQPHTLDPKHSEPALTIEHVVIKHACKPAL